MQPQQANPAQATQAMLQQSKAISPEQNPQQAEQSAPQGDEQDSFDQEILENLEQHLNQIDPRQKQFLASSLQHYANVVIPVLGIVCGQEVMDYFLNIYKQHFAKGVGQNPQQSNPMQAQQQPNSAPNPQGQGPNQGSVQQAQAPQQQAPAQQPQPQQ